MADTSALFDTQLATYPGSYFGAYYLTIQLDHADEKAANIFQVPAACDLTGATVYVPVAASAPAYKMTLQSVDADGNPSGSVLATTAEFTPSSSSTNALAFTADYTATAGQVLAIVVEYSSGTIGGSNKAHFIDRQGTVKYITMPYVLSRNDAGTWGSRQFDSWPGITVQTSLTGRDCCGIFSTGDSTETISTGGHRYAQRTLIADGEDIDLHVNGFRFTGYVESTWGASVKAGCWNAAGAELASVVVDTDAQSRQMDADPNSRLYYFTSTLTISAGTVYYLGFEHNDGGSADDLKIGYMKPGGLDGLKSWPGGASFYASKWDGSSWADDNTRRLCLNPILSSIHGTASGGGSTTAATMGVIG